jgi:hypothetical protein
MYLPNWRQHLGRMQENKGNENIDVKANEKINFLKENSKRHCGGSRLKCILDVLGFLGIPFYVAQLSTVNEVQQMRK